MQIKVDHRPAYALGIIDLAGGESMKAETGAMVLISSMTAEPGVELKSPARITGSSPGGGSSSSSRRAWANRSFSVR